MMSGCWCAVSGCWVSPAQYRCTWRQTSTRCPGICHSQCSVARWSSLKGLRPAALVSRVGAQTVSVSVNICVCVCVCVHVQLHVPNPDVVAAPCPAQLRGCRGLKLPKGVNGAMSGPDGQSGGAGVWLFSALPGIIS